MRLFLVFLFIGFTVTASFSQTCDLGFEDFTGSTPSNPPEEWIKGPGTNIGASYPANPTTDPAVGFNTEGEYMISQSVTCGGQVCFDWHSSSINSVHEVEISFAQTDTFGGTYWTALDTIQTPGSGNTPNTYQNVCYTIPSDSLFAPFDVRIKWEMIQRSSGTFYLENVCIDSGTCAVTPTQFTITELPNGCKQEDVEFALSICVTDMNGYIDSSYNEISRSLKLQVPAQLLVC